MGEVRFPAPSHARRGYARGPEVGRRWCDSTAGRRGSARSSGGARAARQDARQTRSRLAGNARLEELADTPGEIGLVDKVLGEAQEERAERVGEQARLALPVEVRLAALLTTWKFSMRTAMLIWKKNQLLRMT